MFPRQDVEYSILCCRLNEELVFQEPSDRILFSPSVSFSSAWILVLWVTKMLLI